MDILKALCAFFVIVIHIPFPGAHSAYFTALTRVAVPVFFLITGYFYPDTVARHRETRQLRKILLLTVKANLLFFLWNITLLIFYRGDISSYIHSLFTWDKIKSFIFFNESPLAGHLWYLGAILYVLAISFLLDKIRCLRILYCLTPVLLIADLVFGKYSLLIFRREFPYILVRNFLCVGIPYFSLGMLAREKRWAEKWNQKLLLAGLILFTMSTFLERYLLVKAGMNATRDHYISTTFLALCLFVYARKSSWRNRWLAAIGRKYSTGLYILHPIFITLLSILTGRLGIEGAYRTIAPLVVYGTTLLFLVIFCYCTNASQHQSN